MCRRIGDLLDLKYVKAGSGSEGGFFSWVGTLGTKKIFLKQCLKKKNIERKVALALQSSIYLRIFRIFVKIKVNTCF